MPTLQTISARPARRAGAVTSLLLSTALLFPTLALTGCGRGADSASGTTGGAQQTYGTVPAPNNGGGMMNGNKPGMSTKQKVAILAGAAALYYMYKKHQNSKGAGVEGQYYQSKNGRIYYRDAKGNAVYVTPPQNGIQVPYDEAERYNREAQSSGIVFDGSPAGGGMMNGGGAPGPGRSY